MPETGRKIAQEYTLEIIEIQLKAHDTLRGGCTGTVS